MATDTQTITTNEFKLQQVSKSAYKLISWYEAALLSNRSSAPFRLSIPPLNLVLRCRHGSVRGIAYLRKRLQEGRALHAYTSYYSHLHGHSVQLLDAPAGNQDGEASDLQITLVKLISLLPLVIIKCI